MSTIRIVTEEEMSKMSPADIAGIFLDHHVLVTDCAFEEQPVTVNNLQLLAPLSREVTMTGMLCAH